ncbi:MAG: citrate lyase subunit alpha [Synergistaceae bacterium]|nr:citrate lyase subunit alpha [Synergistaceae bacterium]
MNKIVKNIKEALNLCGIKDGMTISFHHYLRNGDNVINMTVNALQELGIKNLNLCASSLFQVHSPIISAFDDETITTVESGYIGGDVGVAISNGKLKNKAVFRSHGHRPSDIKSGKIHIDVAVIAAPTSDDMGNCSGKFGKSACGSLGYAMADAQYADKVIVVTDNLVSYPLCDFSIPETQVDYVVCVDSIGDPEGIVSSTTKITRDPAGLRIAKFAVDCIKNSGLLKNGFSFQTGAGGASLAAAMYLKEIMLKENIKGSFCMGGITGYIVDMLEAGCFETLFDVQCFDLRAVESLKNNPRHKEVSAEHYASPTSKSCIADKLDVVILGATEIDTDFNVNVHTNSQGIIMGGSGGHSDVAAGSKLSIIVAPLIRARLPVIVDRVNCISTPGKTVDILVTQRGIAVNPAKKDLAERLKASGLPVFDIETLKNIAEDFSGKPEPVERGNKIIAEVLYRDGTVIDEIMNYCG